MVQDLQYLSTSVGLECVSRVFGQTERIARPSRPTDLDHELRNLRTAGDLPEPTARVDTCTHMCAQVRPDLPGHRPETTNTRPTPFRQATSGGQAQIGPPANRSPLRPLLRALGACGVEKSDPRSCTLPSTVHSSVSSSSSGDTPVSTTTVWSSNEHHSCSIRSDRSRGQSAGSVYQPLSSSSKNSW